MSDEKSGADLEAQATASSTTLPATTPHHDVEKVDSTMAESSSDADSNHEEIEEMDAGRQADLAIDKVRPCTNSKPNYSILTK